MAIYPREASSSGGRVSSSLGTSAQQIVKIAVCANGALPEIATRTLTAVEIAAYSD